MKIEPINNRELELRRLLIKVFSLNTAKKLINDMDNIRKSISEIPEDKNETRP